MQQPAADGSPSQGDPSGQAADAGTAGDRPSSSGTPNDAAADGGPPETPPQSDPANLEYAKKATDMVLDYLEQQRDQPDAELLEKLNWTEQDLRDFQERWQKTRQLSGGTEGEAGKEFEEALQSLGLRERGPDAVRQQDRADALRNLEDAGSRVPAPPLYRDAFEAFRRSTGK